MAQDTWCFLGQDSGCNNGIYRSVVPTMTVIILNFCQDGIQVGIIKILYKPGLVAVGEISQEMGGERFFNIALQASGLTHNEKLLNK